MECHESLSGFEGKTVPTQEIAADVLTEIDAGRELLSAKEVMKRLLNGRYSAKVRGSVHAYVMETLKRRNTIDFVINLCLRGKKVEDLNPFLRNVLRVGIYEIVYKGVHPALATDSAVRIAKNRLNTRAAALVNAVMRKAERVEIEKELGKLNPVSRIALKYHHPEWYVKLAFKLLGKDAIDLMKANMRTTVYVRVNELKASIESVRKYLEQFCDVEETVLPYVFRVENWEKHPSTLEWHGEGKFVVQDIASAIAAHVLSPEPGDFVVDLAAAPGIKTSQLAMLMENRGKIVAVDNSKSRLGRMALKMKQLGVKIVECRLEDGATFLPEKRADCVLLDPPCSTTGALRNYPCVKWRFDEKKYRATVKLQKKMLENAMRIGNKVLYSTCSITFDENEGNVKLFESRVERIRGGRVNRWKSCGIREFNGIKFRKWKEVARFWPHVHDCCGFFIAILSSI